MTFREHPRSAGIARWVVAAAALLAGAALVAFAWRCDREWFERHVFLPYYFAAPPRWAPTLRMAAGMLGLVLMAGSGRLARRVAAVVGRNSSAGHRAAMAFALVAALVAVEATLRIARPGWRAAAYAGYEMTIGRSHPRYGWIAEPSRVTRLSIEGRPYDYAVGPHGLRARQRDDAADFDRPALVIAGESIASGYGLAYDDMFAVRCARELGLQPVIVAEGGYGFDQAYLRVSDLLPRIRQPVAVVTVFVPSQLGRSLRDDRPHLVLGDDRGLELVPADAGWLGRTRLVSLFRRVPYASNDDLARATALARAVFEAIARDARARGATPLFVVVSLGPARAFDARPEAPLLRALFVESGLPFIVVDLDVGQRFAVDGHPNPVGARLIADAVSRRIATGTTIRAR